MLNPITYTEYVVGDFLRYQLTTCPFADRGRNEHPCSARGSTDRFGTPAHADLFGTTAEPRGRGRR